MIDSGGISGLTTVAASSKSRAGGVLVDVMKRGIRSHAESSRGRPFCTLDHFSVLPGAYAVVRDVSGLGGRSGRASFEGFNIVHDLSSSEALIALARPTSYELQLGHNIPICCVCARPSSASSAR